MRALTLRIWAPLFLERATASTDPYVLRQIVDEGADSGRQMPTLAEEDGMHRLGVAGIERLEDRLQLAGLEVRPDVKLREARDADTRQRQLPCGFAVADLHIPGCLERRGLAGL